MGGMEIATVGAAVLAGTATLATTMAFVGAIGAVAGGLGVLTGNKTLTTVGMVLGAVGGVGALAAGAGLIGGAGNLTEEASFAGNQTGMLGGSAGTAGSTVADTAAIGAGNVGGAAVGNSASEMTDAATAGGTFGGTDFSGENVGGAVSQGAAVAPGATAPASASDPSAALNSSANQGLINGDTAMQGSNIGMNTTGAAPGMFDSVMKFGGKIVDTLNANKGLSNIVGQMATGAMAALSPKTAAETAYDQSMTAMNQQRLANLNAPQPTLYAGSAARPAVYGNGAPTYQQPNVVTGNVTPGILNQGVTGRVA